MTISFHILSYLSVVGYPTDQYYMDWDTDNILNTVSKEITAVVQYYRCMSPLFVWYYKD
jgi:hypothetical protein